jgi:hypothetical protein
LLARPKPVKQTAKAINETAAFLALPPYLTDEGFISQLSSLLVETTLDLHASTIMVRVSLSSSWVEQN